MNSNSKLLMGIACGFSVNKNYEFFPFDNKEKES